MQHHNQQNHQKKQTYVMVQYMPLSTGSTGQYNSGQGAHQFILPPSLEGRCPKLTRYKTIGFLAVTLLSVILLVVMVSHTEMAPPYFSASRAESKTSGEGKSMATPNSAAAASPMCSLSVLQDAGLAEETELGDKGAEVNNDPDLARGAPSGAHAEPSGVIEAQSDPTGAAADDDPEYRRRFPTAIVIGARKAGTRAILRFIGLHPDVVTSRRETHFFDREYDQGLEWYRQQMPKSLPSQMTIEKTPNYLVDWDTPQRVYNFNASIKLILIVRNPISRTVSDYVQLRPSLVKLLALRTSFRTCSEVHSDNSSSSSLV
ncbi:sulfotransferase [Plakobranchus ocellatus]|uniref:Sulfotransferase n=1 Tax=Plakobranchus ocellatus TaxID=259542 RepID=A0AAV3YFF3_9GAST|nr:sulfotransferase [Plakobranchus ocellatus]